MPKRLRYFLERDTALQGVALRGFLGAVEQCLRAHGPGSPTHARIGAIAFIYRFGAALNAHLHFHCVVIDGVFALALNGDVVFHPATAIDPSAIASVQATLRRRLLASFVRCGLLTQDNAQAMAQWAHDGGRCLRLTPLVLLEPLAALVPPPRVHRHRYYGVLAPNAPLRQAVTAMVVAPSPPAATPNPPPAPPPPRRATRYAWAQLLARIYEVLPLLCPQCATSNAHRRLHHRAQHAARYPRPPRRADPSTSPPIAPARGPPLWDMPEAAHGQLDPQAQPAAAYEFDQRIAW